MRLLFAADGHWLWRLARRGYVQAPVAVVATARPLERLGRRFSLKFIQLFRVQNLTYQRRSRRPERHRGRSHLLNKKLFAQAGPAADWQPIRGTTSLPPSNTQIVLSGTRIRIDARTSEGKATCRRRGS